MIVRLSIMETQQEKQVRAGWWTGQKHRRDRLKKGAVEKLKTQERQVRAR